MDIILGASDKEAFHEIYEQSNNKNWTVKVFVVNNLHAKVVLLGQQTAILGSANITNKGLSSNKELGITLYNGDSKISTIKNYLDDFINYGYELSKEQFEYTFKKNYNRFEAKVIDFKRIIKAIKYERDAGLQSFSLNNKTEKLNYFEGVLYLLRLLDEKNFDRKTILKVLTSKAIRNGVQISENRLNFLMNLGLVIENENLVKPSKIAEKLLQNNEPKTEFYKRLRGLYPEFENVIEFANNSNYITPKSCENNRALKGKNAYWAVRLRWLAHLGILKTERLDNHSIIYKHLASLPNINIESI